MFRKEIHKTLNLICDLCKQPYMTTFTLVTYCDDCISELEANTPDE